MKIHLETVISSAQNPPQSMAEVAENLGYDQSFLTHHLPDQCRQITQRHANYATLQAKLRKGQEQAKLRAFVVRLHMEGIYPSNKKVARVLGGILRNPEMRGYYRSVLKELGY